MKIKYIALAVSVCLSVGLYAQHNEEVTIEGTYRPKVNKVNKIVLKPEAPKLNFQMPGTEVQIRDIEHRFPFELEMMAPQSYNGKNAQLPESAKNFLMAGFGSRISPIFLYRHNSNLTKNLGLSVGIKHYSSWLDMEDYAPSSFMNNAFSIGLTSNKYRDVQLGGDVYYKNDMVHYYGVNLIETPLTETQIERYCPRQTYNTIGAHIGLISTSTRVGELIHSGDVDYHYTFDNTYAREHSAGVAYGLGYTQNWWGNKNYPQKIGVDLAFQYEYFEASHADVTGMPIGNRNDLYWMKVNPFFEMSGEFYKLHLGVRLDGVNRIQDKDEFLAVRPDVSGSLFVLNKKLEFYAGLNGGRELLTYSEIISENPFVEPDLALLAKNVKLGFDGGVRANIAEVIDLHLGVRYRHTNNDPMFVGSYLAGTMPFPNNTPFYNAFGLVYDETQQVSALADMRLKLSGGFTADLNVAYNNWKTTNEERAWYRPAMEGKLKLSYDVNEKLGFNATFLYQGGRYGKRDRDIVKCDVYDLGFGADYRFNDQLAVFVKANNLLHQKYQLYYNYPVKGIEFFAGLKMTF